MKQQLTAILLIFALLLTISGCSAAKAVQKLDAVEDLAEAKLDAAEDKLEERFYDAVSPIPASKEPAETLPQPTQAPSVPVESARMLTEEEAKQIALDYLGFTADQVSWRRTEFEIDDGIPQFDVEFHQGDWEYEFEIHGETGKILSFDKDHKYD